MRVQRAAAQREKDELKVKVKDLRKNKELGSDDRRMAELEERNSILHNLVQELHEQKCGSPNCLFDLLKEDISNVLLQKQITTLNQANRGLLSSLLQITDKKAHYKALTGILLFFLKKA